MKIRVFYQFDGRERDYIVNPIGTGVYHSLEDYRIEVLKWFPNAIVESVEAIEKKSEIIELELVEEPN
jgi:hypothetical protein